jgi:prepilin-type N-terminal cleavage/methylation domain-containing protein
MKRLTRKAKKPAQGFTLIEVLVVIGMLAILSTVVLVAVNPLRQFAQARNTVALPSTPTVIGNAHPDDLDLRPCLVSTYLTELPHDPSTGSNTCTTQTCSGTSEHYYLNYTVALDPGTNRVTVCEPTEEPAIDQSAPFCLSR